MLFECSRLIDDAEFLDEIFHDLDNPKNYSLWTHLGENLIFNMGDIILNIDHSREMLNKRNLTEYGKGIGHAVSDIFFMNAIDYAAWTSDNSRIINDNGS